MQKKNNPRFYDEMPEDFFNIKPKFDKIPIKIVERHLFCPPEENFVTLNSLRTEKKKITNTVTDGEKRSTILRNNLNTANLTNQQIKSIESILIEFNQAFYIVNDPIVHTDVVQHIIKLLPNSKPVFTKQYRIPEALKPELKRHIEDLLNRNIIEPSTSPFNSPIFLVKEKNDESGRSHRLVLNFKKLNAITQPMDFPTIIMEDIFDRMANAKVFTTLDVKSAYFHVPLHEKSRPFTAFTYGYNKYQFRSSAFGLVGSGYYWQMAVAIILKNELLDHLMAYVDDIIIFSEDDASNIKIIRKILKQFLKHNIKLKIQKTKFLQKEVKFLSHIFSENGICPDPKRTEAIDKFPRPTNLKETQRFVGLANYYRRFVPGFSSICKPLHGLTKKDTVFSWSEKCEEAFTKLKQILVSPAVLMYPRFDLPFNLCVDASNTCIGAVLSQFPIPNDRPIEFFSKLLNDTQQRYSTTHKELLAIYMSIMHFHHYLANRRFLLITDHMPLKYLLTSKNINNNRLFRWKVDLLEYDFEIQHIPGKLNFVSDALSRINIDSQNNTTVNEVCIFAVTRDQSSIKKTDENNQIPNKLYESQIIEKRNLLINCRDYDHSLYFSRFRL